MAVLTYKVAPEIVAQHRQAHIDWLKQGVADGRVLLAGRKNTSDGGMFMARGSLDEVTAWAKQDPFAVHDLCSYDFIDLTITITAPGLEGAVQ